MPAFAAAFAAALFLGAVMTAGDFVWAHFGVRHTTATGMLHGAAMCLCIGGVIGGRAGRPLLGVAVGPIVGVLAAAAFYAMAPTLGWGAMLPAWMFFWICFALFQRFLQPETFNAAVIRGVVAAVLSGLAFFAISGIWTHPAPGGPNYLVHFLSWTFAFLPGFVVLFFHRSSPRSSR